MRKPWLVGIVVGRSVTAWAQDAPRPVVVLGPTTAPGAADPGAIERVVSASTIKMLDCYRAVLGTVGDARGTMTVTFTVAADGRSSQPAASGVTDALEACVVSTLGALKFPPQPGRSACAARSTSVPMLPSARCGGTS